MSIEVIENQNAKIMASDIVNVLQKSGVSPNLNGFMYIKRSIEIILSLSGSNSGIRITELYAKIGKAFNVSSANVERCIRHAIQVGMCRIDPDYYETVFAKAYKETDLPTNTEYLYTLATYLKYNYAS